MKFDDIYSVLHDYRTPDGGRLLFLLAPGTMRSIYDCVLHSGARECLELGTGYGATTCVIAAALEELGGGRVTTVDIMVHEPIGIHVLAAHTGLSRYMNIVCDTAGYNWHLADMIAARTGNGVCAPCLDFCFLDGAHEWGADALAVFLVAKLLRPGAWLAMDDLDFRLRGCMPAWETEFAGRTEKELDAYQLDRVFNLVLRQHPDFGEFALADTGRTGWARKKHSEPAAWLPVAHVLDPLALDWQETFLAADLLTQSQCNNGIAIRKKSGAAQLLLSLIDPFIILPDHLVGGRPIEVVTLRIRLMKPDTEILQLFWTDTEQEHFAETNSMRVKLSAAAQWQDIFIRVNGTATPRTVRSLRLDPTDGPATVLWEGLSIGGFGPRP